MSPGYISGWCFHRFRKQDPVDLGLSINNKMIKKTSADRFREDLRELGLHPTGKCGFEFIIDPPIDVQESERCTLFALKSAKQLHVIDFTRPHDHPKQKPFSIKRFLNSNLRSSQGPLVLFMHIPKTAGTSFNIDVQTLDPRIKIRTHLELESVHAYRDLAKTHSVLSGHLRFWELNEIFAQYDKKYFTIIREPYAHLHSHLNWLIHTYHAEEDQFFKHTNPAIYSIGERLAKIDFSSNKSIESFVDNLGTVEINFFDNLQTRYFCSADVARISAKECAEALANTKEFELIGLTESYEHFLEAFSRCYGLKPPSSSRKLNRSRLQPLFNREDETIRAVLHPLVAHDLTLYQFVSGQKGESSLRNPSQ